MIGSLVYFLVLTRLLFGGGWIRPQNPGLICVVLDRTRAATVPTKGRPGSWNASQSVNS